MPLENATEIQELVPTNPTGSDPVAEGDNHLRMIKLCLQNSFPGMSAPWTTDQQFNCADPVEDQDAVTLKVLKEWPYKPAIGWPILWMLPTLPGADYVDLEGQLVSRTNFPELFALYGTTYGSGDGTTTFKLPDMRGLFMRVWNHGATVDPDAATRTDRGDGTVGDAVGTKQPFAVQQHSHNSAADDTTGNVQTVAGIGTLVPTRGARQTDVTGTTGTYSTETRPTNIYVRLIIRTK